MNYKKGTQTRGCMKSVMRYVSQLGKTLWDGQQLVSGIGCQPETAFDEFLSTKLLHHKDGGVQFYHMVQSFPKGADVDPRAVHEAARQLAGYFEGCEILVCTHTDREHIHSHCIINSVNFETGKKIHMADEQIQALRVCNDQICGELGLPKFQKDEQRQSGGMSNAEYYPASKGESWKFELMRVIDECMRCAGNREEFLVLLRSEGYDATWTDSRKNITYVTPDGRKCRDNKLHIEKYLKENMEAEFGYRTENDNTRNVDAAQKADGRGAAAGTQRDGHGAELERAARNAGQAVPAADAVRHRPENASDESRSAGISDQDANERRKFRETGWEPEREVFFQLQGADREYEALPDRDPERYEEAAFEYAAERLAYTLMGTIDKQRVEMVQFHQNYSYEDFILGYKPNPDGGFELKHGIFYKFCKKALNTPDKDFFFIIDEINRGNLSKIFGELLMLIENSYRGKEIKLAYTDELFTVPKNLYIIGMMNTADRSLAMIDYALRRRFSFFEMVPGFTTKGFKNYMASLSNEKFNRIIGGIQALNEAICQDDSLGNGFCIGHSYFCNQEEFSLEWLENVIEYDIEPMLKEYWFDDIQKYESHINALRNLLK